MWTVEYYRTPSGGVPMDEYLDSLPNRLRVWTLRSLVRLQKYGNQLREPFTKPVGNGLFELRCAADGMQGRCFFFFNGDRIVVTHGFVKKTKKTPRRELERALRYRDDYEARYASERGSWNG